MRNAKLVKVGLINLKIGIILSGKDTGMQTKHEKTNGDTTKAFTVLLSIRGSGR